MEQLLHQMLGQMNQMQQMMEQINNKLEKVETRLDNMENSIFSLKETLENNAPEFRSHFKYIKKKLEDHDKMLELIS